MDGDNVELGMLVGLTEDGMALVGEETRGEISQIFIYFMKQQLFSSCSEC